MSYNPWSKNTATSAAILLDESFLWAECGKKCSNWFVILPGEISFYDGVDNVTHQCSTNPTPSSYDKVCSNFLAVTGYQFKNHTNYGKQAGRDGVDEVHLLQISQGSPIKSKNPDNKVMIADNKMLAVRKCYRDRPGNIC